MNTERKLHINIEGLAMLKAFEGLKLEAYLCPAGVLTIGHGHTGPDVHTGQTITKMDAELILFQDLQKFESAVRNTVRPDINENEFSALVVFCFNIGQNGFAESTALARFNERKVEAAGEAMLWWDKATVNGQKVQVAGLARRRRAERDLLLKPVDGPKDDVFKDCA